MYFWKQISPSTLHSLALGSVFGMTDTGTVRSSNEDNFLIDAALGLVAVADGMGGHEAGEVASADALSAVAQFLHAAIDGGHDATGNPVLTVHAAVEYANQHLYQTNVKLNRADGNGMGTTLTGLWHPLPGGPLVVFHIGDSRLYRLRRGALVQLTRDQTMYQEALDAGAHEYLPPRNLLLQALGPGCDIEPELHLQTVEAGDLFLLCSDGLYGASDDGRIGAILAGASADLPGCCAQLIEMAKQDGSRDNITAVLLQCA